MKIKQATRAYESWLSRQTPVIAKDLAAKQQAMREGVFPFLRATFYRWAQLWPKLCPELERTPRVLAIGDLHLENFGTWRDSEGRLIWGVNDFDEACPMPYTLDLVRLATSARLALRGDHLSCDPDKACDVVLEGYRDGLEAGGRPFVLAEHNRWLRNLAHNKLRDPVRFWEKMENIKKLPVVVPAIVKRVLTQDLPEKLTDGTFVHRRAGLGSLGRQRFTFISNWRGGLIAREAKPLVSSAWFWAREELNPSQLWYEEITNNAVRVPDPFIRFEKNWVVRRLAPDCSRIELADLPVERDEFRLLAAMGRETANVHLGSRSVVDRVKRDLKARPKNWLRKAAARMAEATTADWKEWKSGK
jgi:hypothetical protein